MYCYTKRYNRKSCFTKYKYDTQKIQNKTDVILINLIKGIDVDSDEFKNIDKIVKDGIENKKRNLLITNSSIMNNNIKKIRKNSNFHQKIYTFLKYTYQIIQYIKLEKF